MITLINTLAALAFVGALFLALKHFPYKHKDDGHPKAVKPTRAQIRDIKAALDRKLTYSSPEMCDVIERLDEHEAAIS